MANQWFRMYSEIIYNPKVQVLPEALRWRYVALLCLHCNGQYENTPSDEIALALRIDEAEWIETREAFIKRRLIDENGRIAKWESRQYISDLKDPTAAERQKRYRDNKRNERNATVTSRLPESDTDTDISTTDVVDKATAKKQPRFDAHRHLMSVGIDQQLADDWLAVRKAKKAAPTKTAIDGIASEANKAGISLAEALAICCQRGWASFKDSWDWRPQGVVQPARPVNGRQAAISNYAAQAAAARGGYESASNVRDITGESCRVA